LLNSTNLVLILIATGLGIMAVHAVNLFRLKDFLKGIDGFDDQRAEICLARLIAMHYDDVNVLKLATKQDLVEDAGILPGDAVRIIAAAKGVVVHTDAGHHNGIAKLSYMQYFQAAVKIIGFR
jgi:hypothetical protein